MGRGMRGETDSLETSGAPRRRGREPRFACLCRPSGGPAGTVTELLCKPCVASRRGDWLNETRREDTTELSDRPCAVLINHPGGRGTSSHPRSAPSCVDENVAEENPAPRCSSPEPGRWAWFVLPGPEMSLHRSPSARGVRAIANDHITSSSILHLHGTPPVPGQRDRGPRRHSDLAPCPRQQLREELRRNPSSFFGGGPGGGRVGFGAGTDFGTRPGRGRRGPGASSSAWSTRSCAGSPPA